MLPQGGDRRRLQKLPDSAQIDAQGRAAPHPAFVPAHDTSYVIHGDYNPSQASYPHDHRYDSPTDDCTSPPPGGYLDDGRRSSLRHLRQQQPAETAVLDISTVSVASSMDIDSSQSVPRRRSHRTKQEKRPKRPSRTQQQAVPFVFPSGPTNSADPDDMLPEAGELYGDERFLHHSRRGASIPQQQQAPLYTDFPDYGPNANYPSFFAPPQATHGFPTGAYAIPSSPARRTVENPLMSTYGRASSSSGHDVSTTPLIEFQERMRPGPSPSPVLHPHPGDPYVYSGSTDLRDIERQIANTKPRSSLRPVSQPLTYYDVNGHPQQHHLSNSRDEDNYHIPTGMRHPTHPHELQQHLEPHLQHHGPPPPPPPPMMMTHHHPMRNATTPNPLAQFKQPPASPSNSMRQAVRPFFPKNAFDVPSYATYDTAEKPQLRKQQQGPPPLPHSYGKSPLFTRPPMDQGRNHEIANSRPAERGRRDMSDDMVEGGVPFDSRERPPMAPTRSSSMRLIGGAAALHQQLLSNDTHRIRPDLRNYGSGSVVGHRFLDESRKDVDDSDDEQVPRHDERHRRSQPPAQQQGYRTAEEEEAAVGHYFSSLDGGQTPRISPRRPRDREDDSQLVRRVSAPQVNQGRGCVQKPYLEDLTPRKLQPAGAGGIGDMQQANMRNLALLRNAHLRQFMKQPDVSVQELRHLKDKLTGALDEDEAQTMRKHSEPRGPRLPRSKSLQNTPAPDVEEERVATGPLTREEALAIEVQDFEPCESFRGSRRGWAFKTGANGLGYYMDPHPSAADLPNEFPPAGRRSSATSAQSPQRAREGFQMVEDPKFKQVEYTHTHSFVIEALPSNADADGTAPLETRSVDVYRIYKNPEIFVIPHFLSDTECQALVDAADGLWERPEGVEGRGEPSAREYVPADQDGNFAERTSQFAQLRGGDNPTITLLENRIAAFAQVAPDHLERLIVVRYAAGQFFKSHHDGQHRPKTMEIFLNEVASGGETDFEKLGFQVRPQKGTAILWSNLGPDGKTDQRLMHAELPPMGCEKFVASCFMRAHPLQRRKKPGSGGVVDADI